MMMTLTLICLAGWLAGWLTRCCCLLLLPVAAAAGGAGGAWCRYERRCRLICWSHVPLASVFDSTGGPTVKVTTDGAPQTPFNVRKSNKGASASTVLFYAGLC
eukprot:COSAG06_NODE_2133_length_7518_cov_11.249495_12_plen_103_part_00